MGLDLIFNVIGAGFNIAYKFNWRRTGLNAKISLVVRIAIKPTDRANIPTVNQRSSEEFNLLANGQKPQLVQYRIQFLFFSSVTEQYICANAIASMSICLKPKKRTSNCFNSKQPL